MTRLPGHCAPRLTPEKTTAQTTPSRFTTVAHMWLFRPLVSACVAATSAALSAAWDGRPWQPPRGTAGGAGAAGGPAGAPAGGVWALARAGNAARPASAAALNTTRKDDRRFIMISSRKTGGFRVVERDRSRQIDGHHLVIQDRRHVDGDRLALTRGPRLAAGRQQRDARRPGTVRQRDPHALRADRDQFTQRSLHAHRVGEVHEMD